MKRLFGFLIILFFLVSFSNAEQNFTNAELDVLVDIPATQTWAEVQLNETSLDFDSVYVGNESDYKKVEIKSRGNVNITITPRLKNIDGVSIFDNLWFRRITSDSWKRIGSYSINRSRTYTPGTWNDLQNSFYIKLDLGDYASVIPFDMTDHKNTIIFEITSNE